MIVCNIWLPSIVLLFFLPSLWSSKSDGQQNQTTTLHPPNGNFNESKFSNTSTSSPPPPPLPPSIINLHHSVQTTPNIFNYTTTTIIPPLSKLSSSLSSPTINNNLDLSKSSDVEFIYSTNDSSLSNGTTINYNASFSSVNLSEPSVTTTTINSTIIYSQSLSTSQQQDQQQQQQLPIETSSQLLPPPFLEFVALSAFGLFVAVSFLVAGVYGCVKIYHSRYPARITFGRKFSTFENPIYVQKASSSCEIDTSRENQAGPTGIET